MKFRKSYLGLLLIVSSLFGCGVMRIDCFDKPLTIPANQIAVVKGTGDLRAVDGRIISGGAFTVFRVLPGFHRLEWEHCFIDSETSSGYLYDKDGCARGTLCFNAYAGEVYHFVVDSDPGLRHFFPRIQREASDESPLLSGQRAASKHLLDPPTEVRLCDCALRQCGDRYRCNSPVDLAHPPGPGITPVAFKSGPVNARKYPMCRREEGVAPSIAPRRSPR